jgi:lambda repressor-like predicted transcriptional regulator
MTNASEQRRQADRNPRGAPHWFPSSGLRRLVALERARGVSLSQLCLQRGIDRRTLQRAIERRWLRSDAADELAVRLGRHPSEIWPDWYAGWENER